MIVVFAYAFPHRKTHDFLVELALAGQRDVIVIAAPFQKLEAVDRNTYFRKPLVSVEPFSTSVLCERLGFKYVEEKHSQVDEVAGIVRECGASLGIVAGARILKQPIIESFKDGIVNFHPGKIPETSGLDALFYTIEKDIDPGVTTHFIDAKVDAGHLVSFDIVKVAADDSIEDLQENIYRTQLIALRRFVNDWASNSAQSYPIDRPCKNHPMECEHKFKLLSRFPIWRSARVLQQSKRQLFEACVEGNEKMLVSLLKDFPSLIESRTIEGWTPLIVAAFNQQRELVSILLELGADPNATANKGTSVLMYAKTALVNKVDADYTVLNMLLEAGARVSHQDVFGKDIFDYVNEFGDDTLVAYLGGYN